VKMVNVFVEKIGEGLIALLNPAKINVVIEDFVIMESVDVTQILVEMVTTIFLILLDCSIQFCPRNCTGHGYCDATTYKC